MCDGCLDLEKKLTEKEQRIKQLSGYIRMFEGSENEPIQEVLAIGEEPFQPIKMTKADFLMAQVDLEMIESHGS